MDVSRFSISIFSHILHRFHLFKWWVRHFLLAPFYTFIKWNDLFLWISFVVVFDSIVNMNDTQKCEIIFIPFIYLHRNANIQNSTGSSEIVEFQVKIQRKLEKIVHISYVYLKWWLNMWRSESSSSTRQVELSCPWTCNINKCLLSKVVFVRFRSF